MPLSVSSLSGSITSNIKSLGAKGPKIEDFANVVANAVVSHFRNASFNTLDTGINLPVGRSSAVGVDGLSSSSMTGIAQNTIQANGEKGLMWIEAVMAGVVSHLSSEASLRGVHPVLGQGVGIMVSNSFSISVGGLQAALQSEFDKIDARGPKVPLICAGFADGIVTHFLSSASKTLTISGGPPDVPVPVPKVGIGNGILL